MKSNHFKMPRILKMSPLPVKTVKQKKAVLSSVAEFLGCWALGGKATLSLSTMDGVTTYSYSSTLHLLLLQLDLCPSASAAATGAPPRGSMTMLVLLATKHYMHHLLLLQ